MDKLEYRVCSVYDTETTNIVNADTTRAYPILYIFNDIRDTDIAEYNPENDTIHLYRTTSEAIAYINNLVEYGRAQHIIPVVCAYNLMFDMQTLMYELAQEYTMFANAQTATSVYTLDLMIDDTIVLRFWDTFYLEMGGLRAMGETCGLPKAVGDWDYTKIRTPLTPLTAEEEYYAKRDVQVIPQYLRWLLKSNEWLESRMFGVNVITKTSLVRQMARREIGSQTFTNAKGKRLSLSKAFEWTCEQEFPNDYTSYALRKACFRGGLTFTAARTASTVVHNVASLDVTSMHHAFINGRRLPVKFQRVAGVVLQDVCEQITHTSVENVLQYYDNPFSIGVHVAVKYTNLRLKENSVFDKWGIAILAKSKFVKTLTEDVDYSNNERAKTAENEIRGRGYVDIAENPVYAFGKLYSADTAIIHVNEIELWNIAQVYDYDSMTVLAGEGTAKAIIPPDFVTLQSNMLFARKTDVKNLIKHYKEGQPYTNEIPMSIPEGIAREAREGSLSSMFLQSYYTSTVKGQFNGIYGTQAQDILKPTYKVDELGELSVDKTTVTTPENYADKRPEHIKVLYTYGMRIVAGSRMHLIIAMILLYNALHDSIIVTGGDTDSLKIACNEHVTDTMLLDALKPLHEAVQNAINLVMSRVRSNFPKLASELTHIGQFEVEDCGGATRYLNHLELWNKARVSEDIHHHVHVTCAGLSRPDGLYTIDDALTELSHKYTFEQAVPIALGYDVLIDYSLSYSLQRTHPPVVARYQGNVTDYLGVTVFVDAPEAICLYPSARWLGESDKQTNVENVRYLKRVYNRQVTTIQRNISHMNNEIKVVSLDGTVLL